MTIPSEIDSGDGRKFSLREADPGDMLDLIEAAGSAAGSSAWMRYALMVCSVSAIDGKPVLVPTTKAGVRDLARKIGNDGMVAISEALYPTPAEGKTPENPELETAKN